MNVKNLRLKRMYLNASTPKLRRAKVRKLVEITSNPLLGEWLSPNFGLSAVKTDINKEVSLD
jgi:hypothetical protein